MTKSVFICVLNHISTNSDLELGVVINPNQDNPNYPSIKITNNKVKITSLLNSQLEKLIGLIEFRNISETDSIIAYSESEFDESHVTSIQHLDLHLYLLKMYFFCLWTVKDNSTDFDLGFLYFQNEKNEFEASSNFISSANFTCSGLRKQIIFTIEELAEASIFLQKNIIIETKKAKVASSNKYNRITIANYFIQHARSCNDLGLKMTSYCSALETLFSNDSTELSHKLSERIAHFLSQDKKDRIELFKIIKKCYDFRSKVIHGDTLKSGKVDELDQLIVEVDKVCRDIMKFSFEKPFEENVFVWSKEKHEEYFLELIMS